MDIGKRIARIFRSWFSRGENVEKLKDKLDETYRTQSALLQKVRRSVADVSTSRKRVELQVAAMDQQIEHLDDQARQAVAHGNDDEARALLTRKIALEKAGADLRERHGALSVEEGQLHDSALRMEQDIEDFRARKDSLAARHTAAAARAEMNSATQGINSAVSDVGQAMASAERHARELEATSAAVDELVAEGVISKAGESANDAAARQFDLALEGDEVDRQLEAITNSPQTSQITEADHGPDPLQK